MWRERTLLRNRNSCRHLQGYHRRNDLGVVRPGRPDRAGAHEKMDPFFYYASHVASLPREQVAWALGTPKAEAVMMSQVIMNSRATDLYREKPPEDQALREPGASAATLGALDLNLLVLFDTMMRERN